MTIPNREEYFDNGIITQPSKTLPHEFRDAEMSHLAEDAALWQFVAVAYQLAEDGILREEAKRFLEWDKTNEDRELWYA